MFKDKLQQNMLGFISKFYADTTFFSKGCASHYKGCTVCDLFVEPFKIFKNHLQLTQTGNRDFEKYFGEMETLMPTFCSEFLNFKYLRNCGYFIEPQEYTIGQNMDRITPQQGRLTRQKNVCQRVSFGLVLQVF